MRPRYRGVLRPLGLLLHLGLHLPRVTLEHVDAGGRRREGGAARAAEGAAAVRSEHPLDVAPQPTLRAFEVDGLDDLLHIDEQRAQATADGDRLGEENTRSGAAHVVHLGVHGAPREDLDGLLVRGAHEGAGVDLGDSVARDRHQVAAERHNVAQQREVTVVQVRDAAAGEDDSQLHEERSAHRLNAEYGKDFGHVVRDRARRVDPRVREDGLEVRAVRFENPLPFASDALEAVLVRPLLDDVLAREDAANVPHSGQLHLGQEVVLHILQEHRGVKDVKGSESNCEHESRTM